MNIILITIFFFNIFSKNRDSSYPFISGDTFRSIATWIYDEDKKDCIEKLNKNEIIFLKTDYLKYFFTIIHPQIKFPYILITHNSDYGAPYKYEKYLDDPKIICWFAQNPTTVHDKLIPIPIGIQNQYWERGNLNHYDLFLTEKNKNFEKRKNFIYINIGKTHPERLQVLNSFNGKNYCNFSNPKSINEYLNDLTDSIFVISPRGNGLDCHRTWEALLAGCIPVVKSSCLDKIYKNLPVMIIDDWEKLTYDDFISYLNNYKKKIINYNKIKFNYWQDLIYSKLK
jgi:hypothetical protein